MTAPQALVGNDYRVVSLDLSQQTDRTLVEGLTGSAIYYVAVLDAPAGAQFGLSFGRRDVIPFNDQVRGFRFACGFSDGLYLTVPTAQPGSRVSLFVGFSPIEGAGF